MAPQREWFEKDYYKVLGVASTASDKELSRAYRKLAKELHPDRNPGAEDRFKEVTAAYEVLGDPDKRKEYDEVRRLGPMAGGLGGPGGFGGGGFGGPGGGTFRVEDMGNLGDLFGGIFGGRGAGGRRARGPDRGADVETELHLSFKDAVHGATTSVNVPQEATCHTCNGTGASPAPPRTPVSVAVAGVCWTTTRVCSPSPPSARSATAGEPWSTIRARPAMARGWSGVSARSGCGSHRASRTASASG